MYIRVCICQPSSLLLSMSVCLSVYLSVCPSIHPSFLSSIHRSIYPTVFPCFHPSIHPSSVLLSSTYLPIPTLSTTTYLISYFCMQFVRMCELTWAYVCRCTRWFKYDRDYLCVNKLEFVPVLFEPPCILCYLTAAFQLLRCRTVVREGSSSLLSS
jgi:hypothetical protein